MDRIFASFMFFTRLPFWKIYCPPREAFNSVVEYWPLVGWLTSSVMVLTMFVVSMFLPWNIAVAAGIIARVLLTGALHEDGLADFCDGFGAGGDRERILSIMKDSHIGTYGGLGLIGYFLMLYSLLSNMAPAVVFCLVIAGDPYCKMIASQIVQFLPYARTEQQAKSKTVYRTISTRSGISLFLQAAIPMAASFALAYYYFGITFPENFQWEWLIFLPCLTMFALYRFIRSRIHGYTGDCCGAFFLLIELSWYVVGAIAVA